MRASTTSVIPGTGRSIQRTRLLIIDPDEAAVAQLVQIFERDCSTKAAMHRDAFEGHDVPAAAGNIARAMPHAEPLHRSVTALRCACGAINPDDACCVVIGSLAQLHNVDLTQSQVVLCATDLQDASGLDALAYIRGTVPDLPVIVIGDDSALAVEAIRSGALDFILADNHRHLESLPLVVEKCLVHQRIKQENERLHRDLKASLAELAVTNHQLQSVIRQLEAMARTDELTGLANRRWFNLMLQGHWAEALRHSLPLACLMIDMDEFKSVNDQRGHTHGDELLRLAAKVIRANCRDVDVPARYGGDEFCVLMGHTQAHEAAAVAQRIQREFEYALRGRPSDEPRVSMSIGIAHISLSGPISAEQLLHHADEAMYAAKAAGKQRIMLRQADGKCAPVAVA
jgi:diguanylate cyclase (GGDEF)-like protein